MDTERICGIYKITNTVNGKVYIGSSTDIELRWRAHCSSMKLYEDYFLTKDCRKYGIESFALEVLEECKEDELSTKELQYIRFYDACNKTVGYNRVENTMRHFPKNADTKPRHKYKIDDFDNPMGCILCKHFIQMSEEKYACAKMGLCKTHSNFPYREIPQACLRKGYFGLQDLIRVKANI